MLQGDRRQLRQPPGLYMTKPMTMNRAGVPSADSHDIDDRRSLPTPSTLIEASR